MIANHDRFDEDDFPDLEPTPESQRIDDRNRQIAKILPNYGLKPDDIKQPGMTHVADALAASTLEEDELETGFGMMLQTARVLAGDSPISQQNLAQVSPAVIPSLEWATTEFEFARHWVQDCLPSSLELAERSERLGDFRNIITSDATYQQADSQAQPSLDHLLAAKDLHLLAYKLAVEPSYVSAAVNIVLKTQNANQGRQLIKLGQQSLPSAGGQAFRQAVVAYAQNHQIDAKAAENLVARLLPAMGSHDPEVEAIMRPTNLWTVDRNGYGIGDLVVESYATTPDPRNINQLMIGLRDIPTSDLHRFEQNRTDALTLAQDFGSLRDFIHDQRPGVHEVVRAAIRYYETGDDAFIHRVEQTMDPRYTSSAIPALRDRAAYERVRADNPHTSERIPNIDILRRLEVNTRPQTELPPPQTPDSEFNALLAQLSQTGDKPALLKAVSHANQILADWNNTGESGLTPSYMQAFAWLERQNFLALKDLPFEDQVDAFKQPWFDQILEFQARTAAGEFDEAGLDELRENLKNISSPKPAYQAVFNATIKQTRELGDHYMKIGKPQWAQAIWSGNTAHELLGLIDAHPADTAVGRRMAKEYQSGGTGYHPGD